IAGKPGFSAEIGGVMMASSQASLLPQDLWLLAINRVNATAEPYRARSFGTPTEPWRLLLQRVEAYVSVGVGLPTKASLQATQVSSR
ncbi:hypothetical protein, partial [Undibacterium sp. CCC1.1]|uniref:hypothetical protein n=1 Tax=Undibacterium sp. CCC1.1 TaxID=3048602 RepID=UPI002B239BA6